MACGEAMVGGLHLVYTGEVGRLPEVTDRSDPRGLPHPVDLGLERALSLGERACPASLVTLVRTASCDPCLCASPSAPSFWPCVILISLEPCHHPSPP